MRDIIDFYRRNPLVLALVAVGGLALSLAVASAAGDGIVLPIVFVALVGVLVGLAIAWTRRRP
jgi:FtsH-binding integral membrane protein